MTRTTESWSIFFRSGGTKASYSRNILKASYLLHQNKYISHRRSYHKSDQRTIRGQWASFSSRFVDAVSPEVSYSVSTVVSLVALAIIGFQLVTEPTVGANTPLGTAIGVPFIFATLLLFSSDLSQSS